MLQLLSKNRNKLSIKPRLDSTLTALCAAWSKKKGTVESNVNISLVPDSHRHLMTPNGNLV